MEEARVGIRLFCRAKAARKLGPARGLYIGYDDRHETTTATLIIAIEPFEIIINILQSCIGYECLEYRFHEGP